MSTISMRRSGFLLGIAGALIVTTCSKPSSAESQSSLVGWMLYTPDTLCFVTQQGDTICVPPRSAVIVSRFDHYLQARQTTVIPDNELFVDGFENLARGAPAPVQ